MTTTTTHAPIGADALTLVRACVQAWDASSYATGEDDCVHPMFADAFEAGHRAALAGAAHEAADDDDATSREQYKRMFHAACADLGAINEALGLDPDDGGADPILAAIGELKARAALASAAQPAAYAVEALVHGAWHIQWPMRPTAEAAEADKALYGACAQLRVVPLYAATPTAQGDAEDALDEAFRAIAGIGVVGKVDGWDVIRRDSALDLLNRRIVAARAAKEGGTT